jgi:hypothetical protein
MWHNSTFSSSAASLSVDEKQAKAVAVDHLRQIAVIFDRDPLEVHATQRQISALHQLTFIAHLILHPHIDIQVREKDNHEDFSGEHLTSLGFEVDGHSISNVLPGGPAFRTRMIKEGDLIEAIDDVVVDNLNVQRLLIGSDCEGTRVELKVRASCARPAGISQIRTRAASFQRRRGGARAMVGAAADSRARSVSPQLLGSDGQRKVVWLRRMRADVMQEKVQAFELLSQLKTTADSRGDSNTSSLAEAVGRQVPSPPAAATSRPRCPPHVAAYVPRAARRLRAGPAPPRRRRSAAPSAESGAARRAQLVRIVLDLHDRWAMMRL